MFEKIALLGIFHDADLSELEEVLDATLGPKTEKLYIRLSEKFHLQKEIYIRKAIRKHIPKDVEIDVVTVSDIAIRWLHLFNNYLTH